MRRILVVSLILPFPPDSGGGRDIFERIKALRSSGHTVDLIATCREDPKPEHIATMKKYVENLWIVPRARHITTLLSVKPFHYQTRVGLKKVSLSDEYDVLIVEGDTVGGILDNPSLKTRHRILRVHNDEARLHRSFAADSESFVKKLLHFAESYKFGVYSPRLMTRCDQLWFISDIELRNAAKAGLASKAHHLPFLVDRTSFKQPPLSSSKVFYAGALSLSSNYKGLIWYLKFVHPQLLSLPGYELVIAGKTGGDSIETLMRVVRASERVACFPDVPDIAPLYASSAAFINPIENGGGVKIKSIDAAIAGLPLVTTMVGAEGTGFVHDVHAVIANSVDDFVGGVRRVLSDKNLAHSMVNASQELLTKSNGPETLALLLETLD